ncbi:ATP synthase complex assembly protein ATP12 PWA37_005224 [Arxiozyma heterogenica]|uniref:ATP synthase complex assembly protein ATP12 n=1 Tax=Arxiozyma heterogenica TaxID=278026 RepID=UPI002EE0B802
MLRQNLKTVSFKNIQLFTRYYKIGTATVPLRKSHQSRETNSVSAPYGVDRSIENNFVTETNKLDRIRKKFWQNIDLNNAIEPGFIHIQMDTKTIRTPMGNQLKVKKDQLLLAYLLKNEWNNLETLSSKSYSLPLTSLTSRCIDLETAHREEVNLDPISKCNGDRDLIIKDLLRYLDTDTLLVFAPKAELEGSLRKEQNCLYLPIIDGIEDLLYTHLPKESEIKREYFKLRKLDSDIDGLRSNMQSDCVKEAAINYVKTLSYWNLAVFEKTVMMTKSFICGILLCENAIKTKIIPSLKCGIEKIERLASLETIHQTDKWGEVEDTHDVNKADLLRNISAAYILAFKN